MMADSIRKLIPWLRGRTLASKIVEAGPAAAPISTVRSFDLDIDPADPLLAYFITAPGVVEIERLDLDSPALRAMKAAGVKLVAPLVSQGELIGLLNLGARRSEQEYSTDDKRLLNTLATQAAPALRVAQLARQQQIEARERERLDQEMRVARVIQETLLPKQIPALKDWILQPYWQPARAVSGDFYDFLEFPDGKLGIVVADVTDKGVPAALVMATARSLIRAAAERLVQPGETLRRANDQLSPDIPPKMFVTCLYILLDPATGDLTLANAGHNLPIWSSKDGVRELHATGMPLGLLPGMGYAEVQGHLEPGDRLLLYSDGIVEAHNPDGEMFGFPRLRERIAGLNGQVDVTAALMDELVAFTGSDWEQEDDVTLLNIERLPPAADMETRMAPQDEWVILDEFTLPSAPGNERLAMRRVADAVVDFRLDPMTIERLKTAVAESTMNAMEHGNKYREDLPAEFQVLHSRDALMVRITDFGGGKGIPERVQPDLDAKLEGLQSPRGWGLFLIQNMVDEMRVYNDGFRHTVELIMRLEAQNE